MAEIETTLICRQIFGHHFPGINMKFCHRWRLPVAVRLFASIPSCFGPARSALTPQLWIRIRKLRHYFNRKTPERYGIRS